MNRKLLSLILLIATCSMLVQSRTNTITCEGDDDATGGQTCCPVEEVFVPDYSPLDPTWDCDGEAPTFVALPEAWEGSSQQVIKELIESIWDENWSLLFSSENFRCTWFPGCEIAELAVQDEASGIYTLRCRTCNVGYRKTDLGLCEECTVQDCDVCNSDASICLQCASGYFIGTNGANCADIPNCQVSDLADAANDDCTTCMDGYYVDVNGDCQMCDTGYLTCSDIDVGITCDEDSEYFLDSNNVCEYVEYCESTTAALAELQECQQCMTGYYEDVNNVCQGCSTGYITCTAADQGTCDEDLDYFANGSGGCILIDNCQTALNGVCEVCDEDQHYFAEQDGYCEYIQGCSDSSPASAELTECDVCDDANNYFLESNGNCVHITGCTASDLTEADLGECDTCDTANNYFLETDGDCVEIIGCTASDLTSADLDECDQCDTANDYFLASDETCVEIDFCQTASAADAQLGECTTCDNDYFHDANLGCTDQCITGALTCEAYDTALTCDEGNYYFIDSNDLCELISDCESTSAASATLQECDTCDEGYWNDGGDCTFCDTDNYYFLADATTCYQIIGCESATDADKALSKCSVCEDGWYLDNGDCVFCPDPYIKCSDADTPIQCDDGYNLIGGECREIDYCCIATYDANANPTTTCTQCFTAWGYLLSEGQCVDISNEDDCAEGTEGTANTAYTCTRCNSGYKLENSACVSCGLPSTQDTQPDCEACGYSWIQDQCVQEENLMTCIVQDDTTGDCIVCNYGSNWDAVSGSCLPCDSEVASWWDDDIFGETESFTALETCTISTWVAPEPPADGGDSGDNGDNAYSMIFNMIALVVLSLCAFFIV